MSVFDTLAFVERLESAGVDAKLSRSLAHAMHDIAMADLVTKADLERTKNELLRAGLAGLVAAVGVLSAVIALV